MPRNTPGQPPEPTLDAEQETQVRALLADARVTEPAPPEVVDRLDRVLAGLLRDEPPVGTPVTTDRAADDVVVRLASRRRRARSLLLVAAAVVVGGVGGGQIISATSGGSDAESTAASDVAPGEAAAGGTALTTGRDLSGRTPLDVTAERFAADVARIVETRDLDAAASTAGELTAPGQTGPAGSDGARDRSDKPRPSEGAWFECPPAAWGPGRLVPVVYDGEPAVLALRPPAGDSRVVDLLQCGTGEVLRSLTLPVG